MDLIKKWLVAKILGYRRWSLRRRVMVMQLTLMNEGRWEVSFDLCHMILEMVPRDLLKLVTRTEEEEAIVSLGTHEIDVIMSHLDTIYDFISYEIEKANGRNFTRPRPKIQTHNYSDAVTDYSFGRVLSGSVYKYNSVSLLHALTTKMDKITGTDYKDKLPEITLSYVERMTNVIASDCFELTTVLMGLVLHEQQIKTAKERFS